MSENKFIIWRAWVAMPVVGLMLGGLYVFEGLDWLIDLIKDFLFQTSQAAYQWARNPDHQP